MFLTSLENVALLLAMAIPGFIVAKLKMLKNPDGAINFISILLLYICQPFITFNSFLNTDYQQTVLFNLIAVFLVTAVIMVAVCSFSRLILIKSKDSDVRSMIPYAATFGNVGYMCIPFLQILRPGDNLVILYATASIVAFNLAAWTMGNYILTRNKKFISLKKAFFNPPTISFLIALPLFMLNLNFNRSASLQGVAKVCRLFAELVGPMSMTLLGIKFSEIRFKELLSDYRPYLSAGLKLILAPFIAFCILFITRIFYNIDAILLNVVAFAAMPTATNLMMFSSLHDKDVKLAAKIVLISTLLSVLTIPLVLGLSRIVF
jgi:predicted permease